MHHQLFLFFFSLRRSREIASAERTFSARAEQEKTDSFDISSTWKPGYTFPSLKACMVERDFNIKIVSGKKRVSI